MQQLRSHIFLILSILLVFFFLRDSVACAPTWSVPARNGTFDTPETYTVCLDLPPAQRAEAHRAVEMWDRSLHQWKHLVAVDGANEPCSFIISETSNNTTNDPMVIAWTSHVGGSEIFVLIGRYENDVTGILLHELGHALGAQHVPGTLMNDAWQRNLYVCPDVITVAQVAAYNHISLMLLSWCTP